MTHERKRPIALKGLPEGWYAEYVETRGYDSPDRHITAQHSQYGSVSVGVGSRVHEEDKKALLKLVDCLMYPDITKEQWINVGQRRGVAMQVFVDLDGVLADWLGPALAVMGEDPAYVYRRWERMSPRPWNIFDVIDMTPSQGWRKIDQAGDRFWANLPIKPYARELLALCESIGETTILTSPSLHPSSYAGKVKWLDHHFGKGFARGRALLGASKHLVSRPGALLIDDSPVNCEKWVACGGSAILFPALGNEYFRLADDPLPVVLPTLVRAKRGLLAAGELC